jgi:dTMP kinase
MSPRHPRFITFEGVDGAGKSTHLAWFADTLAARLGAEVVLTREPGGTRLGEALRTLVLHEPMHLETEALLMFAVRRQHLADVIEPALARGAWVVCDRFTDATVAYQGAGRGLPRERIETLRRWVHPHLEPALTILFDLAPEIARQRMDATRDKDRFERESGGFFDRVRSAYLALASAEPDRFRVVDSAKPVTSVEKELEEILSSVCSLVIKNEK